MRANCRDAPCHSPEELRKRLGEPGTDIRTIKRRLLKELEA